MENLIPIINKLQDVFNTVGSTLIDLPQIAVVGCQSSGKSSVLEAFVGRDFLPRGSGIVTRRPLVLQLNHLDDPKAKEYGIFLHDQMRTYTNFDDIQAEIVRETERVAPSGNISPVPIGLKLWSPNVLTLTVVDLPGLVKNAVGDQAATIVEEIHKMVYNFISKPNSLILAVTPANQDLANSDALRIAREVDAAGDRTVGVITKIDLMDAGTDCRDILMNKLYPLKLGYIGVVNRSQQDLNHKTTVEAARRKEREFFDNSRDYSDLADRCGSAYLVTVLNQLLMEHIRTCMPGLRTRVQTLLTEKENELRGYGDNPASSRGTMNAFALDVITKYMDAYQDLMQGHANDDVADLNAMQSLGGARVSRVFLDEYFPAMDKIRGLRGLPDADMFWMMKNHTGITSPVFTPPKALDTILFRAIEQFRKPSLALVDKVVALLFDIHSHVEFFELTRFTSLADSVRGVVDLCIRSCVEPTRQFVNGLVDNERTFVNTTRPDFKGAQVMAPKADDPRSRALPELPAQADPTAISSAYGTGKTLTPHQAEQMRNLIEVGGRYYDIVREQLKDMVPKAIVKFLVDESTQLLRPKMIEAIFNSSDLVDLLHEDPAITKKRIACQQIVDALRKAKEILNEVRSFKV